MCAHVSQLGYTHLYSDCSRNSLNIPGSTLWRLSRKADPLMHFLGKGGVFILSSIALAPPGLACAFESHQSRATRYLSSLLPPGLLHSVVVGQVQLDRRRGPLARSVTRNELFPARVE